MCIQINVNKLGSAKLDSAKVSGACISSLGSCVTSSLDLYTWSVSLLWPATSVSLLWPATCKQTNTCE